MEQWKDISGYEGYYQISTKGRLRSVDTRLKYRHGYRTRKGRIIKPILNQGKYLRATLSKHDIKKNVAIHKLVGYAFISNPDNKPTINHINGIKTDNRDENLEWMTYKENMQHASKNGLLKRKPKKTYIMRFKTNLNKSMRLEVKSVSYYNAKRYIKRHFSGTFGFS